MADIKHDYPICPNCGKPVMLRISLDRQLSDLPAFLTGCDNLGTGDARCPLSWADGFSYADEQTAWQAWHERCAELASGDEDVRDKKTGKLIGGADSPRREAYEKRHIGKGGLSDDGNTYYSPYL